MRFTQVSRQSFVGIVVLEQELGPRPLPLSLAVFCGLTESQIVEMIPCYFASFGEPSPQRHTGAGGTRDKLVPLVKDVAFDEAHDFAGTNHSRFSAKLCLPNWPQKVDFQFDRSERLAFGEGIAIGNAHRGICQIAEHSAMKRAHRIRIPLAGFEFDRSSTGTASCDHQTQEPADWSGKFFWRRIWARFDNVHRIELSLCFRRVRVDSQVATDLSVRELVFVGFNNVIHFPRNFLYIQELRQNKFRSEVYEGQSWTQRPPLSSKR
jgi:hypothetical protein